jgi:penicillin-binding protein 1A
VALPIFEPILQAVWAQGVAPKAPLNGPSPEAKRYLVDLPIDYTNGSRGSRGSREGFVEHFRIGADGKIKETQYQLASREAPSRPRKADTLRSREGGESAGGARSAQPEARGGYGAWGWGG